MYKICNERFNTSYVNVYQMGRMGRFDCKGRFNTSYVNVYRPGAPAALRALAVSIHPMLMFIFTFPGQSNNLCRFNTSYVNVYLIEVPHTSQAFVVSIHPMLMFINVLYTDSANRL